MSITTVLKWILLIPIGVFGLILLLICPLIVLIKGMVIAYDYGFETPMSLLLGSTATFLVLLVYILVFNRIFQRRFHISFKIKLLIAGVMVLAFNGHALFILSEQNVKARKLTDQYTDLHPMLRVGVRTWTVFDPGLVITDMSRNMKDYGRMRVRAYHRSLHFRQKDGYVHAVDLRTTGRSQFRNWVAEMVFRMMGFGTLRHVGTADHLHIQLGSAKEREQLVSMRQRIAHKKLKKKADATTARKKRKSTVTDSKTESAEESEEDSADEEQQETKAAPKTSGQPTVKVETKKVDTTPAPVVENKVETKAAPVPETKVETED